jgi:hypothetical protein
VSAECQGYRNTSNLIFLDQTRSVERKVFQAVVGYSGEQIDKAQRNSSAKSQRTVNWKHDLPSFVATPVTELVPCLFFHYFDVQDVDSGHAFKDCLPQRLSTATTHDDALSSAILSVGFALLSRKTNSPGNLISARRQYANAVRLTCNFLETSSPGQTCWAIRIIFILSVFEVCDSITVVRLLAFFSANRYQLLTSDQLSDKA